MLNPGNMQDDGDAVIEAAAQVDVAAIKAQLTKFAAIHNKWSKAQSEVVKATTAQDGGAARLTELDAAQDVAIDALVDALARDGFDRLNPFKGMARQTPSKLKRMGQAAEGAVAAALTAKVKATAKASALSKKAAATLESTAKSVITEATKLAKLAQTASVRIAARDALGAEWVKAFSSLKLAATLADGDAPGRLLRTLFPKKKTPAKPKKVEPPAPT